ncbi:peptidase inhibitor family I36 protein [Micromonospora pisi]|uniref:peptidase inhibitor family I36 protein n=1 Tax=Micromonospora pisi TaxID=589240 RepID=UPI001FE7680F|nr:peptidase inhibitor family I36 protein [Micromonospora pisi]
MPFIVFRRGEEGRVVLKRFTLVALIGALISAFFGAVPAYAATARNGVCETGEFCLYYNSNHQGSVSDFATSISDYGDSQPTCYEFKSAGNGQGLCVKNNAAAAWNRTSQSVTVFYNSGYAGASQTIGAGGQVNLNAGIKNENAAHRFGAPAAARDGVCHDDEFCLYYNSDHQGSVSDFATSVSNYGDSQPTCYEFKSAGNGQGLCVKNNAAAAWNRTSQSVTVFYNSGYAGASQTIPAGGKVNLNAGIKNENASHRIGGTSGGGGGGGGEDPGPYPAPPSNPHPSAASRAPNATDRTQFVDNQIANLTGETHCWVGDYRSYEASTTNHNTGNALDCTISDAIGSYPNAAQEAQGWKLARWLQKYASELDVRYVIWDGMIWSVARSSEGWRTYTAGSGVTGGHYDHVHVSIQNPYGD